MNYSARLISVLGQATGMASEPAEVPQDEFLARYPAADRPQILAAMARIAAARPGLEAAFRDATLRHRRDALAQDIQADHDMAKYEGER